MTNGIKMAREFIAKWGPKEDELQSRFLNELAAVISEIGKEVVKGVPVWRKPK